MYKQIGENNGFASFHDSIPNVVEERYKAYPQGGENTEDDGFLEKFGDMHNFVFFAPKGGTNRLFAWSTCFFCTVDQDRNVVLLADPPYEPKQFKEFPDFDNPNGQFVTGGIPGYKAEPGDFGFVTRLADRERFAFVFVPIHQKKNELASTGIPTLCHGRGQFKDSKVADSVTVAAPFEVPEGDFFVNTNLFLINHLHTIAKSQDNGATLTGLQAKEFGGPIILALNSQELSRTQQTTCNGEVFDSFVYTPSLVPGKLIDSQGGEVEVLIVKEDGIVRVTSECCDNEEEEPTPPEEEEPEFLKYRDSFGIEQFLFKSTNNSFGAEYFSLAFASGTKQQEFEALGLPINTFPSLHALPVGGGVREISVNYGSMLDVNTPKHNQAVVTAKQNLIDSGANQFGQLDAGLSNNSLEGLYTLKNPGNPSEPQGFTCTIERLNLNG